MKKENPVSTLLNFFLAFFLASSLAHAESVTPPLPIEKTKTISNGAPLLYESPVAFTKEQHGQLSFLAQPPNFDFAARTNIIPLLINETSQAVRYYPLVFVPGPKDEPLVFAAMVGVGDGLNRFVESDKQWRPNTYIPAYVRQYPFLAVNTPDGKDTVLAIDTSAEWTQVKGPVPFYGADGKPTERLEQTLAFSREFQLYAKRTTAMVQALQDAGVLEEGTLNLLPQGITKARSFSGFLIVSETKLNALSDENVLKLHKSGAMGLAYAQLLSLSNLNTLVVPATSASAQKTKTKHAPKLAKTLNFAKLDK
jgi:hypothetical protein